MYYITKTYKKQLDNECISVGYSKLKLHSEKVSGKEKYELRITFRVRIFHLWWGR